MTINTEGKQFLMNLYYKFVLDNKFWYIALLITLFGLPIHRLVIPNYYGNITNQIQKKKLTKAQTTLFIIIGLWVIIMSLDTIKSYIIEKMWPRFNNYCRTEIIKLILHKYSNNYESVKTGLIQAKINDIPWVLDSVFNLLQKITFETFIIITSTFVYLLFLDIKLSAVFTIGIILLYIISTRYINKTVPHVCNTETVYENYFEEINEILANLLNIFTNNKEDYNINKINNIVLTADEDYKHIRRLDVTYKLAYYAISIILFMALLIVGLSLYKSKKISSAQLVSLFIIAYTLLGSIMIFYYNIKSIIINKGTIDVINSWFASLPKTENNTHTSNNTLNTINITNVSSLNKNLDIVIDNLWFRYCNSGAGGHKNRCKDSEDKWLYRGLSLTLKENEHTVIIGHIGSGKSTFAKVLIKLYSLDKENGNGTIMLGGHNIKTLDTKLIRQLISYTPQKTALFNDTLWNNIKYGFEGNCDKSKTITPELALNTLRRAGLTSIADIFSNLMHKPIGKLGSKLSGGQQQIIWLLRAMFNNSRWIIMDEPTNNLDPESIKYVKLLIKEIQSNSNKTTIIITHDKELYDLGSRRITFVKGAIAEDIIR